MAPPPSTPAVSPLVSLIIRLFTFLCLLISLIIVATSNVDVVGGKVKFDTFYAYRYMLATAVIGMAYALLQTAFTVFFLATGNRFGGDGMALFEFYGDKAFSYMLATGAAAGFGLTVDLKRAGPDSDLNDFLNKANAAAALLFLGFIFAAVSSIFSSFSLPKRA